MKKIRLNIYVGDPVIRKQVKTASARHDISVSEYCLQAIVEKLAQDHGALPEDNGYRLAAAIEKAKQFQKKTFAGRTFSVSSTTLIAQARKERAGR